MLGLKRHTVVVVDHCPEWLAMAERSIRDIGSVCHDLVVDVQHAGSTAVPGLPAKPIIDIVIGVHGFFVIDDLQTRLAEIGYIYRGVSSSSIGHLFVRESAPEVRTEHVHVVLIDTLDWKDYIAFRDILLENKDTRDEYARLKSELAARFAEDREGYTSGKHDFIQDVLSK